MAFDAGELFVSDDINHVIINIFYKSQLIQSW